MTEDDRGIHAHAVALWDELVELLHSASTDAGGDTSLPWMSDLTLTDGSVIKREQHDIDVGQQVLEMIERKLTLVAKEARRLHE